MSIFRKLRSTKNLHAMKLTNNQTELHMLSNNVTKIPYTPGVHEELLSKCDAVRVVPYSNPVVYELGKLVLTNFKICFVRSESIDATTSPQVNKLINNDDVILNNIDAAYKVSGSKKKKLGTNAIVTRRIYSLEIHCKDFRVHLFNFWPEVQQDAISTVNTLLQCVFCATIPRLTRFSIRVQSSPASSRYIRFNCDEDWSDVLLRLGVTGFKAVQFNSSFSVTSSLPECFVVPSSMTFANVQECSEKFIGGICPLWSYTHTNNASLIRMSFAMSGLDKDIENQMLLIVKKDCSSSVDPVVFNLTAELPSLADIYSSHASLCQLCQPSKFVEVWRTDHVWYSSLETCHWLLIVSQCMALANTIAKDIAVKQHTVILKEREAVDMAPLIASLVQLMLDPYCRTVIGFQELIDREWVALGHRFYDRYSMTSSAQSPVFLLYLDCVSQLRAQYPSDFEFSEIYLVRIWDSLCSGAFRTFSFNNVHDNQCSIVGTGGRRESSGVARFHTCLYGIYPSVWDWSVQFNEAQIALNFDPLFAAKHGSLLNNGGHCVSPNSNERPQNGNKSTVLEPNIKLYKLKLWALCYLRWIAPLTIVGGGSASEYLTQCLLVEEIQSLQGKIASCESSLSGRGGNGERRKSMLVFGSRAVVADQVDMKDENHRKWNSSFNDSLPRVSSSFPFAEFIQNSAVHCVSVDSYGQECSSFHYDCDVDDDDDGSLEANILQNESFVVVDPSNYSQSRIEDRSTQIGDSPV